MRTATLLRGHVERTLQEHWDRRELVVDDDGDYQWRAGRAVCWVRVEDDPAAIRHACDCVGSVAEEIGPTLAAVFGGSMPLPAEVDHADDDR